MADPAMPSALLYCDPFLRIICVREASKSFDGEEVVRSITFDVPRGAIFGFIGPSGSGKTTTIRMLTGVLKPTRGEVTVLGKHPGSFTQGTREQIGYMPQHFVLYPNLTVWENLNFTASIYGMSFRRGKHLKRVLDLVELSEHRNKKASEISGGMQRRLSLAATLVHKPELIFLDEPTAGIDPVLRRKLWDHFRELQVQGMTLFITTQYVSETAYCDLVGVMAQGRLLTVDTPDGLRHQALGGDLVDLRTSNTLDSATLRSLVRLPFARGKLTRLDERSVRLVVNDASRAIPALLEWCRNQGLEIESVEEYVPPYDDIFVELIRKEERNYA